MNMFNHSGQFLEEAGKQNVFLPFPVYI